MEFSIEFEFVIKIIELKIIDMFNGEDLFLLYNK